MSEANFDTYSTPSRDHRLADEIIEIRSFLKTLVSTNSLCRTKYYSRSEDVQKAIDLAEINRRLFTHQLSSNPNHPPEIRFGEVLYNYKDNCSSWGNLKLTYGEP